MVITYNTGIQGQLSKFQKCCELSLDKRGIREPLSTMETRIWKLLRAQEGLEMDETTSNTKVIRMRKTQSDHQGPSD